MLILGISLKNSEWIKVFFEKYNRNSSKELAIFFGPDLYKQRNAL